MKPIVYYADLAHLEIGRSAWVFLRQHPVSPISVGGEWVFTSRVQAIHKPAADGPVFETLNSLYMPSPYGGVQIAPRALAAVH